MKLSEIAALEQEWIGRVEVPDTAIYFDWQPASVELFSELLDACMPYVPGNNQTFLDVGCGIGTKCLLAAQRGLIVNGFDRVPGYVIKARSLFLSIIEFTAEDFDDYGDFGLVYVNHPVKDQDSEAGLERVIHEAMSSGSVFMSINYAVVPNGWPEISRIGDWNAAWVKP